MIRHSSLCYEALGRLLVGTNVPVWEPETQRLCYGNS